MIKEVSKDTRSRMEKVIEDFRHKQMVKTVHEMAEDHKTAIRNIRRDSNEKLKKALKDKTISEDEEKGGLDDVQKLTDQHVAKIGDLAKHKEDEIMKV